MRVKVSAGWQGLGWDQAYVRGAAALPGTLAAQIARSPVGLMLEVRGTLATSAVPRC